MKQACCTLLLLILASLSVEGGTALRLYYTDIPGGNITDLISHPSFPDHPTASEPITDSLEKLNEYGDAFGTLTRGFLEAPQSGDYIFLLASDDNSEFWLSPTSHSADRKKIIENLGFVNPRDYTAKPSQRSAPIRLKKGEKYYFEVLHKDHIGYDHISVAWYLPDGTLEAPISASRLFPLPIDAAYRPMEKAPVILSEYHRQSVSRLTNAFAREGDSVTFSVSVEANPPPSFQWLRNHQPIPDANLSTYIFPRASMTNNKDLFTVVISNRLGKTKGESMLTVQQDIAPPTVLSSLIINTHQLAVFFSEPVDSTTSIVRENYKVDGMVPQKASPTFRNDLILLTLAASPLGRWQRLEVKSIKDQANPPNTIMPSSFAVEPGLKAWLPFDNIDSTNTPDFSTNHLSALLTGGLILSADGKNGSCLRFDGVDDFITLPSGMSDFVSGMTVAFWARPTALRSWARFIDFSSEAGDSILFGRLGDSNNMIFDIPGTGAIVANGIEVNSWQHFAATLDRAGRISLYKDGSLLITTIIGLPKVAIRTKNFVGRSSAPDHQLYEGEMDDLRIYTRALSAAEIGILVGGVKRQ